MNNNNNKKKSLHIDQRPHCNPMRWPENDTVATYVYIYSE